MRIDEVGSRRLLDAKSQAAESAALGQEDQPYRESTMARDPIGAYARGQTPKHAAICRTLRSTIEAAAPKATVRIWHSMPVWFVGENPIVGYKAGAKHVNLLFWNGQAFDEPVLTAAGKFRAAQIQYTDAADIDPKALRRWVRKAAKDVWDFRAYSASMRRSA